jgi:hypothetical protein
VRLQLAPTIRSSHVSRVIHITGLSVLPPEPIITTVTLADCHSGAMPQIA